MKTSRVGTGMLALMFRRHQVSAWSSMTTLSRQSRIPRSGHVNLKTLMRARSSCRQVDLREMTITEWINGKVSTAMGKAFGNEYLNNDTMITPATKSTFGDFQCNAAFSIAKPLNSKPRDVAFKLVDSLEISDIFETPTIAGPGFINLKLRQDFVMRQLEMMFRDTQRLGTPIAKENKRVVIDFSSPNIAKEMHVGHLRSTIIGDVLSRVLKFRGHNVLGLNHVGDWGTQFGMLITMLKDQDQDHDKVELEELATLYKAAKIRFDEDEEFRRRSREAVVALQAGDPNHLKTWQFLCEKSRKEFDHIYDLLDIKLEERGESYYNPMLDSVVHDLEEQGLVEDSGGAQVVFLEGFKARDNESKQPLIIRKSDGGFNYATTDLAAVRQRTSAREAGGEAADRLLYVVDAGQKDHFEQVFQVAERGGFVDRRKVSLEHVSFGVVLGEDGKKLKTRSGDTVKLKHLLEESIVRARDGLVKRIGGEKSELDTEKVARIVGIGAVKYADLSMNRESNYRFSYSKMLALNGNTAPYMLYAYARIRGIHRKLQLDSCSFEADLEHNTEIALAKQLLKFPDVILRLEKDLSPHIMCEYLFELGQCFNQFYETCPVMQAPTPEVQKTRGALCELTANTLRVSLGLLGIGVVDML